MKFCKFNKNLVKVLVIAFTFYSVIFLISDFQTKRMSQSVTYAQPKAVKEATISEAVNQIEEVRQQLAEVQGRIKRLQDQITKVQLLPWPSVIIIVILVVTAIFIWSQVSVAKKTRQQEIFMLLVSELNKMEVYPKAQLEQHDGLSERQRMDLIVQLHNYLDGVQDIITREGNIQEGKIKKLAKREKYQMRLLMWYKNLQIYYIWLKSTINDLPSHWETDLREARSDPHSNPNSLISIDQIPPGWFHDFSKQEEEKIEEIKKMMERKKRRE